MGDEIKKYKILAFDPGIGNTGWSLLEGNTRTSDLVVLKMGEFHPGPTADKAAFRDQVAKYEKRTISLDLLRAEVTKLLLDLKPDFVCSEDIYISMFRPQAYGSLAMWMCMTQMTAFDVANKKLFRIPTKICKKCLAGSGGSGKLDVQRAVKENKKVTFKHDDDKRFLTEHQADSIAAGFAFNECNKDYILITLGLKAG
jgi:Holliday junction resolvasome RuvABC endonuclease subunit